MSRRRCPRLCNRCNRVRPHAAKQLCITCYTAVHRPYQPTGTGPGGRGIPKDRVVVAGREEDFAELFHRGLSIAAASAVLGVSSRTGGRYRVRLQAREAAAA